ncbi:MAG: tRNA (adenosine(37)-N6)-threonylcarbamoyltransferase complex transferase subunit TsaD [Bacillota bacterium]
MYILGLESSCDESAASILEGKGGKVIIKSSVIASQINIHARYGGVIPEIAAREHVLHILPTIETALTKAKIKPEDIKAIAVTQGPGLITSLIAAVETAKALAIIWNKPIIPVHHIVGHIYADFIGMDIPKFPALALVVSGGHSNLIYMSGHYSFKVIGRTRDDAAGEAYDKAAKMMGLSYPGGPIIARYADEFRKSGKEATVVFPRPMISSGDYDFSFSGLKTSVLYALQKDKDWKKRIPEYCYAFEQAVIETLITKTLRAAKAYKVKSIVLAGGVAANDALRQQLRKQTATTLPKVRVRLPEKAYTTDNAAMIASAGYFRYYQKKEKALMDPAKFRVRLDLKL